MAVTTAVEAAPASLALSAFDNMGCAVDEGEEEQ